MTSEDAMRLDRVESRQEIAELPFRYALSVDARDIAALVGLFTAEGRRGDRLASEFDVVLRTFSCSVHHVTGQKVDLDASDLDRASGAVYCRAEHEVGNRWFIMSICYFDDYRREGGSWRFARRQEQHFYSADVTDRPQDVAFSGWSAAGPPSLPGLFPTWAKFWGAHQATTDVVSP